MDLAEEMFRDLEFFSTGLDAIKHCLSTVRISQEMIAPSPIISVLPETHLLVQGESKESHFSIRDDGKGKEYISLRDDDSHLEWRVTKTHRDSSTCAASLVSWLSVQPFNMSVLITVPESGTIMGQTQIGLLESVCSSFLVSKTRGDICASAWRLHDGRLFDILRGDDKETSGYPPDGELVPETDSVRIKSVLDFQRFIRRLEHSVGQRSVLFIRFVLFDASRIIHFILIYSLDAEKTLSVLPQARMARKAGASFMTSSMGLTERCLIPLLAGNAKPFIVVDATEASDENIVTIQTLLDIGEKMCITALPCEAEVGLRIEDFDIIESIDKLPPRKGSVSGLESPPVSYTVSPSQSKAAGGKQRLSVHISEPKQIERKSSERKLPKPTQPEEDSLLQELSQLELEVRNQTSPDEITEVEQLRAKNLALKCEVDRLAASGDHSNSYSNHLVQEVKSLRMELARTEAERRKYETSKRLLDTLMDKSNKLKLENASKTGKIEEMKKLESVLRSELAELKRNCEFLINENRQLGQQVDEMKNRPPSYPRETTVESFYHEFLFPFNRKKETAKTLVSLHETLQKIERAVAVNAPSSLLDVRRCQASTEKVKEFVNELISASEKLEVSAVTLIKKYSN